MVPVEESVKVTINGFKPLVGLAEKAACGTNAPMPVTEFVSPPPLAVLTTTALVKVEAASGANLITRFVEPKPGKLKGVPEIIVNSPAVSEAVPLVSAVPPRLVSTKLASAVEPTATVPKSRLDGKTPNWGGGTPRPVIALVLLPPSPVKSTALLKLPVLGGLKLTTKLVEPKPGQLKGVPERIVNAAGAPLMVARPLLRGAPPRLVTTNVACTVSPTATGPKFQFSGETESCGG